MNDKALIIKPIHEYAIVFPGGQAVMKFEGSLEGFVDYIEEQIKETGKMVLKPKKGVIMVLRVGDGHLPYTVMTKQAFESYGAQQQILQNLQGGMPGQ